MSTVPEPFERERAIERTMAQVAHNHLTLRILPHLEGRCRCKTTAACEKSLWRCVQFAAKVMRLHGAGETP